MRALKNLFIFSLVNSEGNLISCSLFHSGLDSVFEDKLNNRLVVLWLMSTTKFNQVRERVAKRLLMYLYATN